MQSDAPDLPATNRPALHCLLAVLLGAAVLIPRGLLISHAHSDTWDTQYHIDTGIRIWRGTLGDHKLNDPPLGEALVALPVLLTGCYNDSDPETETGVYGQRLSAQTLCDLIAVWKS